jgi:arylsulfatase A-like enzyme
MDWLDDWDGRQPFFLNVSFARPHSPYVPPQHYFDLYYRGETPPAHVGDWADMHDRPDEPLDVNAWRGRKSREQIHLARSGYYGEISFIDTQIGRLLNYLRVKGRTRSEFRNTWIVFVSDHGDMQGDHNLWRKTYAYEGSARIPLLICPPGLGSRNVDPPARRVADEPVSHHDLMPTILEMAGLEIPESVEGRSLLPLTDARDENWREYIHGEHSKCYGDDQEMQYLTDGREKYVWLPLIGVEQFFDLSKDPGETRNLIDDPASADRVELWRDRLREVFRERECDWLEGGKIQAGTWPLVSPWQNRDWPGAAKE